MGISFVHACLCGAETECTAEDQQLGAVFQCPKCESIWGCVKSKGGGRAWIEISPMDAAFNNLLKEPE